MLEERDPTRYRAADRDAALLVLLYVHDIARDESQRDALTITNAYLAGVKGALRAGQYERLTPEAWQLVHHALTTPLDWNTREGNARRLLQWIVGEVWCARDGAPRFVAWAEDGWPIIPAQAYRQAIEGT